MCVSLLPANFDDTAVMLSAARHPERGIPIMVMAYQNEVQNRSKSNANAMLLHFPARSDMGEANVVDTKHCPLIVSDMISPLMPRSRGIGTLGMTKGAARSIVEVFDSGIYTIVMSNDAAAIPDALDRVREDRRPMVKPYLFRWYGETFPGWKFALCCFSNRDAVKATPMVWWYEPMYEDKLMLPGIDCHTGEIPKLTEHVFVNHWVIAGSRNKLPGYYSVHYQDSLGPMLEGILPKYVRGKHLFENMKNGDFLLSPPSEDFSIQRGLLT